ncbi:Protein of unknown function [Lactobacillus helveticus CIRM-BIA 953]|uniref:Uncharacterized protein n=1 Tax=Lactobacillus helveticus CIRM-BIA 953 TaxID=1226335 RepID=U4QEI0_LACHE|nr:Protein of unknown function [Lactobacillus helveticus CIRM-BIA 953]
MIAKIVADEVGVASMLLGGAVKRLTINWITRLVLYSIKRLVIRSNLVNRC